jgi:AhpD family alkylhydroperoxidase
MVAGRIAAAVAQRQVKYITPVPVPAARGLVAEVYTQVADEFRIVVPPALLHSPAPDLLAAYWMLMREPLVASGAVDRLTKEAVAAAVSVGNICPYCVDMHSTGMYGLSTEHDAEAIVRDRVEEIVDPHVRQVAAWARTAHLPDRPEAQQAPFPPAWRPELVGVVVSFHYLTRMVNVFLSSFLIPPRLGPGARRRFKRGISRVLAPALRADRPAGRSLDLLPHAALPPDATWAAGHPDVAPAVARAYAAFEAAGTRSVPESVRVLVGERLDRWRGEETGLSRGWCEDLVADLPEAERAVGRLVLLTALASHQVDEDVVSEFRRFQPDDTGLLEAAAWASIAAARRVGAWHRLPTDADLTTQSH